MSSVAVPASAASTAFAAGIVCISFSGIFLTIQSGCNATLGTLVGRSLASVVSFATGLIALIFFFIIDVFAVGTALPAKTSFATVPWWGWVGGPLGAFYIASNILFAHVLGSAMLTSIFVTGQLCTAVVLDAQGWVGFPKRQLQWPRILGLAFMIVGMVLISLFRGDTVTESDPTPPAPPTLPASPLPPPPQELPPVNGSLNAFDPASASTDMAAQASNYQLAANTHAAAQVPDNHTLRINGTSQTPDSHALSMNGTRQTPDSHALSMNGARQTADSHALSINGDPGLQSKAVDAAAVIIDVGNPIPDATASGAAAAAPDGVTATATTAATADPYGATAADAAAIAAADGGAGAATDGVVGLGPGRR